jgi:8-oxo-dGTP diphosphatase
MTSHFVPIRIAVLAVIEDQGQYLLLRRFKTGWRDGFYTCVGGHLEGKESLREAMARELKEEVGIEVSLEDLEFVHLLHISANVADDEFLYNIFRVKKYSGVPSICEPDKSDALEWFPIEKLPENIVPLIGHCLQKVQQGEYYSEYGWKDTERELA